MWIEELQQEIEDADEIQDVLREHLDNYCDALEKEPGMTMTLEEADELDICYEENWKFIWTDKASKLIDAETHRLWDIGQKYYSGEDITVETSRYNEY